MMKTVHCAEADRIGRIESGPEAAHLAVCKSCRDAVLVAEWMQRLRDQVRLSSSIPSAQILWLRSRFLQIQGGELRAGETIRMAHFIAYLVVALCWSGFLTWKWPTVDRWLIQLADGRTNEIFIPGGPLSLSFLVLLGGLICLTVMAALPAILAEE